MDLAIQLTAVLGVLAGLAVCVRLMQRRGLVLSRSNGGPLLTAARIQLTPQHSLHLVRFGQKELLIAAHPSGCTVVDSGPSLRAEGSQ